MKTYSKKASEIDRKWWLIDASTMPLGKLAVVIADKLSGKYKVNYTPNIDDGDYVVVINAKNVQVTGEKITKKMYYRHSGYPGGLKEARLEELLEKDSSRVIEHAVKGMLPKNKLLASRLTRLRVFADENHTHAAQNPQPLTKENA